jgi:hypothetical protein
LVIINLVRNEGLPKRLRYGKFVELIVSTRRVHGRETEAARRYREIGGAVHDASEKATHEDIKKMAARLLDDQRNDPQRHKSEKPRFDSPSPEA